MPHSDVKSCVNKKLSKNAFCIFSCAPIDAENLSPPRHFSLANIAVFLFLYRSQIIRFIFFTGVLKTIVCSITYSGEIQQLIILILIILFRYVLYLFCSYLHLKSLNNFQGCTKYLAPFRCISYSQWSPIFEQRI